MDGRSEIRGTLASWRRLGNLAAASSGGDPEIVREVDNAVSLLGSCASMGPAHDGRTRIPAPQSSCPPVNRQSDESIVAVVAGQRRGTCSDRERRMQRAEHAVLACVEYRIISMVKDPRRSIRRNRGHSLAATTAGPTARDRISLFPSVCRLDSCSRSILRSIAKAMANRRCQLRREMKQNV